MSDLLLVTSSSRASIAAPIGAIDLTGWLFNLSDAEYQACSKDHLAAASGFTCEGKRLSINVETIGGDVLVQHYVEQVSERSRCVVRSISDAFTHFGLTKMDVTWSLQVTATGPEACEFENRIEVRANTRADRGVRFSWGRSRQPREECSRSPRSTMRWRRRSLPETSNERHAPT